MSVLMRCSFQLKEWFQIELVYMPNKPHKRGFKAGSMAGSKSGYVHHIQMSGDKTISHAKVHHSIRNSGLVVLELTEKLPEKSHIYFDNYLASPLITEVEGKRS